MRGRCFIGTDAHDTTSSVAIGSHGPANITANNQQSLEVLGHRSRKQAEAQPSRGTVGASRLAQHLRRNAAATIGSVPELTPVAIPPTVCRAACCQAASVRVAGADRCEPQPTYDGCRHRLGDGVPGSKLAIEVVSPSISLATLCVPARVETSRAYILVRKINSYS